MVMMVGRFSYVAFAPPLPQVEMASFQA